MPAPTPPSSRRSALPRGGALAAYVGAWTLLASVYAAAFAAVPVAPAVALRGALAAVLPGALFGLVALDLARRWPSGSAAGGPLALRLVPAVLALTVGSIAGWYALICVEGWLFRGVVKPPGLQVVMWEFVINLLIQVALTGIGYANRTAAALRDARDVAARAEVLRARAELQVLRSQLQPHFVNNVLHAMLGLVRRDPTKAESVLEKLGELLRYGQSVHQSGSDWVPLAREWDFVRSYLDLERIRLGNRLRVYLESDDAALEVPVPPFALQPLVENAILHAVAPRVTGGRVDVSARRSGGRLRLDVRDDGPGRSEAEIAASPRIGLRLLQDRLAALYDGQAKLSFDSPPDGGFRVRLDLPDEAGAEVV